MSDISLTCKFIRFRYRSPDFSVLLLKISRINQQENSLFVQDEEHPSPGSTITAVGEVPDLDISENAELDIIGQWSTHKKYGRQLKIASLRLTVPEDKNGILSYLSSGVIKGIGKVSAGRLVDRFGTETLKILDEDPERIKQVPGIGRKTAEKIVSSWKEQKKTADAIMALCSLGLSVTYARKAIKTFGENAAQYVKGNPYILVEIHGVGFQKADAIAKKLDIPEESPERIKAGLLYCIQEATFTEGHCYLPVRELLKRAEGIIRLDRRVIEDMLPSGERKADMFGVSLSQADQQTGEIPALNGNCVFVNLSADRQDGKIYLKNIYEAERYVSRRIEKLAHDESPLRGNDKTVKETIQQGQMDLTHEQKEAIKTVLLGSRMSVISGLPGVGKTTSVKAVLNVLNNLEKTYALAAPTGKAAKRLAEQAEAEAKTIHRMLEVQKNGAFARNEENPLDYDYVIVDEASMVDLLLMQDILKALGGSSCLILIGDPNQLPSIGPGRILQDIIEKSLCPARELREIHRQARDSAIVHVAHRIYAGNSPVSLSHSRDFLFIKEDDVEAVKNRIVQLVSANGSFSPGNIQVLTPMKRGPIGSYELNEAIQKRLSPCGGYNTLPEGDGAQHDNSDTTILKSNFRRGDRVIQMLNNYTKEVFNGEIGYIGDFNLEDRETTVVFPDKSITYEEDELDQLSLAYCLTIHKSQGSEFPCVIIPVHTQHYVMLYRNLIYTAATRAKEMLIFIGTERAMSIAVKNRKQISRFTDLSAAKVSN